MQITVLFPSSHKLFKDHLFVVLFFSLFLRHWSPLRWWLPFHEGNILKSQPVLTSYVFKEITKIINALRIMLSRLMSCLLSYSLRLSVPSVLRALSPQGDSPCLGNRLRVYPSFFVNPLLWQFRALPRCIFKILCFNFFGWVSFPPFFLPLSWWLRGAGASIPCNWADNIIGPRPPAVLVPCAFQSLGCSLQKTKQK